MSEKYWFTVHWPHPLEARYDEGWHIFLKRQYEELASAVSPGNKVLFYETTKGRRHILRNADGTETTVELLKGRGGIVREATVTANKFVRPPEESHHVYADRSHEDWMFKIPCGNYRFGPDGKFVDGEIVRRELCQPPTYFSFRGGLLEINRQKYETLLRLLLSRNPPGK